MFKFSAIVILALAVCVAADPIRQRILARKPLARQQLAPTAAPTGYPAAGVTPEIPFDLPTEPQQPEVVLTDNVTSQPDEIYGPPEIDVQQPDEPEIQALQPDEVYGPPEDAAQPDEVYGPPGSQTQQPAIVFSNPEIVETVPEITEIEEEAEDVAEDLDEVDGEVLIDEDGTVISVSSTFEKPARLIFQRFPQGRQAPKPVPARLIMAKLVKPAKLVYTARFQNFQRIN